MVLPLVNVDTQPPPRQLKRNVQIPYKQKNKGFQALLQFKFHSVKVSSPLHGQDEELPRIKDI